MGLVLEKYLPAGLHAVEASYVSASSLSAFRAAIVRSVWSGKMPLADTPVVLNLLDGLVGVDPAPCIVWDQVSSDAWVFGVSSSGVLGWLHMDPLVMRLCSCFLSLLLKMGLLGM